MKCPDCDGRGEITTRVWAENGHDSEVSRPCWTCHGTGDTVHRDVASSELVCDEDIRALTSYSIDLDAQEGGLD